MFDKSTDTMMQLSEATRKRINFLLKQNDMKLFQLSKEAGISLPTLTDFMKNDTKNLRMDTMLHICEGFKITLKEFYDDKLFDDVMSE